MAADGFYKGTLWGGVSVQAHPYLQPHYHMADPGAPPHRGGGASGKGRGSLGPGPSSWTDLLLQPGKLMAATYSQTSSHTSLSTFISYITGVLLDPQHTKMGRACSAARGCTVVPT